MSPVWIVALVLLGVLALVSVIIWLGLRMEPEPLELLQDKEPEFEYASFASGLSIPVRRYFELVMGPNAAVINTTTLIGRGKMRLGPLWAPVRFRASYRPGKEFHRMMEILWFGRPVLKGLDTYLDRVGKLVIAGKAQTGPALDQAQNLALWGEGIWMPSVFALDPGVRWEQHGEYTARLVIPFEESEDELIMDFCPESGLPEGFSARRYRGQEPHKTGWKINFGDWRRFGPVLIPIRCSVRWEDERGPWLHLAVDDVHYNEDVSSVIPPLNPAK